MLRRGAVFLDGSSFTEFYIDGSVIRGHAAWAAVCPLHSSLSACGSVSGHQTSIRAELSAAVYVLESTAGNVRVFTDCPDVMAAARCIHAPDRKISRRFERSEDLLQSIIRAGDGRCCDFVKIRGHTGGRDYISRWNDEADARAREYAVLLCDTSI